MINVMNENSQGVLEAWVQHGKFLFLSTNHQSLSDLNKNSSCRRHSCFTNQWMSLTLRQSAMLLNNHRHDSNVQHHTSVPMEENPLHYSWNYLRNCWNPSLTRRASTSTCTLKEPGKIHRLEHRQEGDTRLCQKLEKSEKNSEGWWWSKG